MENEEKEVVVENKEEETVVVENETKEAVVAEKEAGLKNEEKTFGMLYHLLSLAGLIGVPFGNILGPLVIWLVKKNESSFVDQCGKESLNFQISLTIYAIGSAMLFFILIGMPLLIAVVILYIVCVIKASIKANNGEVYKYPLTIRFIK